MNSPAKVPLLSLNCSEGLAATGPTREDAVFTAELVGAARCEPVPCGGCECWEEVDEAFKTCRSMFGVSHTAAPPVLHK